MITRLFLVTLVLGLTAACPKRVTAAKAQSIRLLSETPERETTQLKDVRTDLEIDTRDFDRTPHVVASGETALFSCEGTEARLYGDEAGTKGFFVDNVILLEVLGADGKVLRSAVIGYADTVMQGKETIDNLGRRAFTFDAGELNITGLLPEHGSARLRATVLDYFGVGKVSDVFVKLEPKASGSDDLNGQ